MAIQRKLHYSQDLQGKLVIHYGDIVFNADNNGVVIDVDLLDGGEAATMSGTVAGAVICPDGSTVALTGSSSGNTVSIALDADCVAIPGQIGVGIQVVNGTTKTTVFKGVYNVDLFETDNPVDPGSRTALAIGDLVDDIETAVASIPADYSDLLAEIAPTFSNATAYPAGQYVWYDGDLYRFTTAHSAGSWNSAEVAAAVLGNDLGSLKSALEVVTDQPQFAFTLGKNISTAGVISDGTNGALTGVIPVLPGDMYVRESPGYDGDGVNLSMQLAYYNGETFVQRVSVAVGTSRTIPANVNGIRVWFGHPSNSGVAMTQEVIDGYFSAKLYRSLVTHAQYNKDITYIEDDINKSSYGYRAFRESDFIVGNLYSAGEIVSNDKRVCTPEFMILPYNAKLKSDDNYRVVLCTYSSNTESSFIERNVNHAGSVLNIPANVYFRIAVYKATEETISNIGEYASAVMYESEINSRLSSLLAINSGLDFLRCFHKFCGIGDSLMAGFTQINGTTENSTKGVETGNNWFQYLMTRLGREGHNLAIGSSTTHNWRYGSQSGYPSTNLNGADIDGVDCYFVGLGVNDMIHPGENTIGTSADIENDYTQNADSTYGNLDYILHKLAEFNQYAKVFVFTVPWYGTHDITDVNEAIRYVCSVNSNAYCIDLADDNNPVADDSFIKANYTGNHFNPMVYNLFSLIVENRVNEYIYNNYTNFVWIPYKH